MLKRDKSNIFSHWWWSIDRALLFTILILAFAGLLLVMGSSPAVALRIGLASNYFIKWHSIYLCIGVLMFICLSFTDIAKMKHLYILCACVLFGLLVYTTFLGHVHKGARRWVTILGFSLQPSELLRPAFIVFSAYFISQWNKNQLSRFIALSSIISVAMLLLLQPDLGMCILFIGTWVMQIFLIGLPIVWFVLAGIGVVMLIVGMYFTLPHVQSRINMFLFSNMEDKWDKDYQMLNALNAIKKGGWFGLGPGEGMIKHHIPDAHADFIFAVAGEEFGILFCILLMCLFVFTVYRGVKIILKEENLFLVLVCAGATFQIALQVFINIASSIGLVPTKGMTLPLISYGGSSTIATYILFGIILSISKRHLYNLIYKKVYRS